MTPLGGGLRADGDGNKDKFRGKGLKFDGPDLELRGSVQREGLAGFLRLVHSGAWREEDPSRELIEEAVSEKSELGIFREIPPGEQTDNYRRLKGLMGPDIIERSMHHDLEFFSKSNY